MNNDNVTSSKWVKIKFTFAADDDVDEDDVVVDDADAKLDEEEVDDWLDADVDPTWFISTGPMPTITSTRHGLRHSQAYPHQCGDVHQKTVCPVHYLRFH